MSIWVSSKRGYRRRREAGTLDVGIETFPVDAFEVLDEQLLRTDPSGAETWLKRLELRFHRKPLTYEHLMDLHRDDGRAMRNAKSGRIAFVAPAPSFHHR